MDTATLINELCSNHYTVATAESCTGGLIASSIVDVSGASECFNEGYVTYSNQAKMKNLGVSADTLNSVGAVSKETATEMALGVRRVANATFGLSSTGIAGPTGGTKLKPVGLVYIGCAYSDNDCIVKELHLNGDRSQVRAAAAKEALNLLAECIDKLKVMA